MVLGMQSSENFADWSDQRLACAARRGSLASFEELVRRFQVPLLRFLIRHVGNRADAEDLLQEAFVRAYTNLDRYRSRWHFRTWLYTITHRLAMSHHRQAKTRAGIAAIRDVINQTSEMESADPGDHLSQREERGRLWDIAKQTLTDEQFTAVWLYYVEDLSGIEIAAVLDRSWVSVKTILHRARRRLTERLAGTALDPGAAAAELPPIQQARLHAGR